MRKRGIVERKWSLSQGRRLAELMEELNIGYNSKTQKIQEARTSISTKPAISTQHQEIL